MVVIKNFNPLFQKLNSRFPGTNVPVEGGDAPSLHLFHAANSVCSQKVRAVLLTTRQAFVSHSLDIFKGETYDPDHVRLRAAGCLALGIPLAADHTGTTSATTAGCDACVVPMIAIPESEELLLDSKKICIELDRRNPVAAETLMPPRLTAEIEAELAIVDDVPNYQLGVAAGKTTIDNSVAMFKVSRCDALIAEHGDDESLRPAYEAKRSKELAAATRLFDDAAIDRARAQTEEALGQLDARLRRSDGPYLFGAFLTMADVFWGVELIRINDFGMSSAWEGGRLTALAKYYETVSNHPGVSGAFDGWPGARAAIKPASKI